MWRTGNYTRFSGATENNQQRTNAVDAPRDGWARQWPQWDKPTLVKQPADPTVVDRYVDTAATAGGNGTTNATAGANRAWHSYVEAIVALAATDWPALNQRVILHLAGTASDSYAGTQNPGAVPSSAASYLTIQGNAPNALQWDTSSYRFENTGALLNSTRFVRFSRFQFRATADTGGGGFGSFSVANVRTTSPADVRLDSCYIEGVPNDTKTGDFYGVYINVANTSAQVTITNCLVRNFGGAGSTLHAGIKNTGGGCDTALYNNTVIDCRNGIYVDAGGDVLAKNNGVSNVVTDGYVGTFRTGSTTNASSLAADAPGTSPRNSVTPTFVGASDYHLASSDTAWIDQGTDLSTDARFVLTTDGDGTIRGATWDIGADEVPTAYTLAADAGTYAITGGAARVTATRILPSVAGAYTETGAAASLRATRLVAATAGNYVISGAATRLTAGHVIAASAGAYAITGGSASLRVARTVAASAGSYALSGAAARLSLGRLVAASAGVYTVTGAAADLAYAPITNQYVLSANAGAYTVTGADALVARAMLGPSAAGAYAETGASAALNIGRVLHADAGAYAETGADAELSVFTGNIVLNAEAGVYNITGADAYLRAIQQGTGTGGQPGGGSVVIIDQRPLPPQAKQRVTVTIPQPAEAAPVVESVTPVVAEAVQPIAQAPAAPTEPPTEPPPAAPVTAPVAPVVPPPVAEASPVPTAPTPLERPAPIAAPIPSPVSAIVAATPAEAVAQLIQQIEQVPAGPVYSTDDMFALALAVMVAMDEP